MSIDTPTSAATFTSTQMFLTVGGEIEDLVGSWAVRWRNVVDGAYYDSGAMHLAPAPSDVFEGNVPLRRGVNVITVTGKNVNGDEVADTLTVDGVRVRLLPLGGRDRRLLRHQHRRAQARPRHRGDRLHLPARNRAARHAQHHGQLAAGPPHRRRGSRGRRRLLDGGALHERVPARDRAQHVLGRHEVRRTRRDGGGRARARAGCSPKARRASSTPTCCSPTTTPRR